MSRQIPSGRLFVEGMAIVASILLAFTIDAWWDGRRERGEERESLEVLARDLAETIEQLGEFKANVAATVQASLGAYVALSGDPTEQKRAGVSEMLDRSLSRHTLRLPKAGYTDLLSTGGLRLVRDRTLRDGIIQFYETAQRSEEVVEKNSALHTDGHLAAVLIRDGLVLRRPVVSGITQRVTERNQVLRDLLGPRFEHPPDPLWGFAPDSREWDRARSALLQNARGIQAAADIGDSLLTEASNLREAIRVYLDGGAL